MKVDVYSIMRNEIKILPYFLRHYETFADRIFVWDDGSDDGTKEMLGSHSKVKLIPINLGKTDNIYFILHLWPQYKEISRGSADWVICVDADEFIYHPNIIKRLEELEREGVKRVCCRGFTMCHPSFPTTTGQIYDEVRFGVEDKWSTKTVVFTPDVEMKWGEGRHTCNHLKNVKTVSNIDIYLLHFRYLGWDYYMERTKKNLAYTNTEFTMKREARMPDGSRDAPYKWYENHKDKLMRIVE